MDTATLVDGSWVYQYRKKLEDFGITRGYMNHNIL